jgi:bacteriocin-like protein
MKTNALKLSLRRDTIRVLSNSEMSQVIGGLANTPVQAARHPTFVCVARQFAAAGPIVR